MADDISREQQASDERDEPVGIFDPLVGCSSDASQTEVTAAPSAEPARVSSVALLGWVIGVGALGFLAWFIYLSIAINGNGCPSGDFVIINFRSGGAASGGGLLAAAVLGGSLWVAAGVTAFKLRRELGLLIVGFVALYAVGLVVLWNLSPLIWGPRHCP